MENQLHFHLSGKKSLQKQFENIMVLKIKNKIRNLNYPRIYVLTEYMFSKQKPIKHYINIFEIQNVIYPEKVGANYPGKKLEGVLVASHV